jgi:hypothetical protein
MIEFIPIQSLFKTPSERVYWRRNFHESTYCVQHRQAVTMCIFHYKI